MPARICNPCRVKIKFLLTTDHPVFACGESTPASGRQASFPFRVGGELLHEKIYEKRLSTPLPAADRPSCRGGEVRHLAGRGGSSFESISSGNPPARIYNPYPYRVKTKFLLTTDHPVFACGESTPPQRGGVR